MNNHQYSQQFKAMQKLHGTDGKHTCQFSGCKTMCLGKYCFQHIETGEDKPTTGNQND